MVILYNITFGLIIVKIGIPTLIEIMTIELRCSLLLLNLMIVWTLSIIEPIILTWLLNIILLSIGFYIILLNEILLSLIIIFIVLDI